MFMRRPSYLDEDSGSKALAGESSRIVEQFWNNPKNVSQTVSQTVSHWLSATHNSLLHTQLELEARVGIEPNQWLYQKPCCHSNLPARTQDTNTTLLTLAKSQGLAF